MSTTIYAVEGAIFACVEASYLALRTSLSASPLEQSALVPAAVLGIFNLLCTTVATSPQDLQKLNFHVTFAFWLTFLYSVVECFVSPSLASALSINPIAAAVSLAMLTVHMLISAAPVQDVLWQGTIWADIFLALVTNFHACVSHGSPQIFGLSVFILFTNFLVLALVALRVAYPFFPPTVGLGNYNLKQILEILKVCTQALSVILALVAAYLTYHTTWALIVACLPPIVILSIQIAVQVTDAIHSNPSAPSESDVHREPQQTSRRGQDAQGERPSQPQDIFNPRPAPFNPAVFPAIPAMSKFTQDALLFKNTRSLINAGKKNS
jgi:hypothetical protein